MLNLYVELTILLDDVDRETDGRIVIQVVSLDECLNPTITIGGEANSTSHIKLTNAMHQTQETLLIEVIIGAGAILHRKPVDDLMDQTGVVTKQFVDSVVAIVLLYSTDEFKFLNVAKSFCFQWTSLIDTIIITWNIALWVINVPV